MYSHEIEKLLKDNNYDIDSETYCNIFNPNSTPQITYGEYNQSEDRLKFCTSDNYEFNFKVHPKDKVKQLTRH